MSRISQNDLVTLTRADLAAIADAISADPRSGLTKPAVLGKIAATLLGPKHDWSRIKNAEGPVRSQRAASRGIAAGDPAAPASLKTVMRDGMTGAEITAEAEISPDGTIQARLSEGLRVWIEYNDGCQRVHVFDEMSDGPFTVQSQPGHRIDASRSNYDIELYPASKFAPVAGQDRRPVIGYQVDDPITGENWNDRPSFEILPLEVANQDLDDAYANGVDRFRLLPIREGDIEEPSFFEA